MRIECMQLIEVDGIIEKKKILLDWLQHAKMRMKRNTATGNDDGWHIIEKQDDDGACII